MGIELGIDFGHSNRGAVPKWPKGMVCKTIMRGFESLPRLQFSGSANIRHHARSCAYRVSHWSNPTVLGRTQSSPYIALNLAALEPGQAHHLLFAYRRKNGDSSKANVLTGKKKCL